MAGNKKVNSIFQHKREIRDYALWACGTMMPRSVPAAFSQVGAKPTARMEAADIRSAKDR